MDDSNPSEGLTEKRERNREQRLDGVHRWVEYVRDQPPEVWGPQQNRLVDTQLESARETGLSADHERRVRSFAETAPGRASDDSGRGPRR